MQTRVYRLFLKHRRVRTIIHSYYKYVQVCSINRCSYLALMEKVSKLQESISISLTYTAQKCLLGTRTHAAIYL